MRENCTWGSEGGAPVNRGPYPYPTQRQRRSGCLWRSCLGTKTTSRARRCGSLCALFRSDCS
jgi:hypothetical protein